MNDLTTPITPTAHPHAVSAGSVPPAAPEDRISPLLTGRLAMAYGALCMVYGAMQAVRGDETARDLDPGIRTVVALFAVSLVVLAPVALGLTRWATSRLGGRLSALGTVLLGLGAASSAVNGRDLSWFMYVAGVANLLWLVGSVLLAVSLWRAGRVRRWVAVGIPVTMPLTLVLAQSGGGLGVGAFWAAVGVLAATGALERAAR